MTIIKLQAENLAASIILALMDKRSPCPLTFSKAMKLGKFIVANIVKNERKNEK